MFKLTEIKEALLGIISKPLVHIRKGIALGYRGKHEFNDKCIGCGACSELCPAEAIEIIDNEKRKIQIHLKKCIFCGECEANCPVRGVVLSPDYELAVKKEERGVVEIERDLVRCEICGSVITTTEHMKWIAQKLGALAYSNPTLSLFIEENFDEMREKTPLYRTNLLRILCLKCRMEVSLSEQWGV